MSAIQLLIAERDKLNRAIAILQESSGASLDASSASASVASTSTATDDAPKRAKRGEVVAQTLKLLRKKGPISINKLCKLLGSPEEPKAYAAVYQILTKLKLRGQAKDTDAGWVIVDPAEPPPASKDDDDDDDAPKSKPAAKDADDDDDDSKVQSAIRAASKAKADDDDDDDDDDDA